jgi:hypothetical protein
MEACMATPVKEHLSTDTKAKTKEEKLDKQLQDSFPASDPPSYSSGTIGAPKARESDSPGGDSHEVLEAEKKVKSGDAKKPKTY